MQTCFLLSCDGFCRLGGSAQRGGRNPPDFVAVDGLSFEVAPGESFGLLGPNGAGKSTLVNALLRFYDLDSGRILLDGTDIATVDRQALRDRAMDNRSATRLVLDAAETWIGRKTNA